MTTNFRELPEEFKSYIKDDPVRPELTYDFRTSMGRQIFTLDDGEKPLAICCVAYCDQVPLTVEDMSRWPEFMDPPRIAVFYTVWSYKKGAGRKIIFEIVDYIHKHKPHIMKFVTLSPKTDMARRFHLLNGAVVLNENKTTDNYEYRNV